MFSADSNANMVRDLGLERVYTVGTWRVTEGASLPYVPLNQRTILKVLKQ
jgi:hypothetical protein